MESAKPLPVHAFYARGGEIPSELAQWMQNFKILGKDQPSSISMADMIRPYYGTAFGHEVQKAQQHVDKIAPLIEGSKVSRSTAANDFAVSPYQGRWYGTPDIATYLTRPIQVQKTDHEGNFVRTVDASATIWERNKPPIIALGTEVNPYPSLDFSRHYPNADAAALSVLEHEIGHTLPMSYIGAKRMQWDDEHANLSEHQSEHASDQVEFLNLLGKLQRETFLTTGKRLDGSSLDALLNTYKPETAPDSKNQYSPDVKRVLDVLLRSRKLPAGQDRHYQHAKEILPALVVNTLNTKVA